MDEIPRFNNGPRAIDKDTSLSSQAIKEVGGSRSIPKGFYERSDGIVSPERLRRRIPQITINGHVDQKMFKDVSEDLVRVEEEESALSELQINFSSFGGSVTSGFGVHDLLRVFARKHNIPLTITGYGPIMSMGALIIQSGDIRRMPQNSRMLFHPVSTGVSGEVDRVEYRVAESRALYTMYSEIVAERVQKAGKDITADQIQEMMKANMGVGTYLTSKQALEMGFIDEIV
jgi:ATP-dependent protease ClpP protease subunit